MDGAYGFVSYVIPLLKAWGSWSKVVRDNLGEVTMAQLPRFEKNWYQLRSLKSILPPAITRTTPKSLRRLAVFNLRTPKEEPIHPPANTATSQMLTAGGIVCP